MEVSGETRARGLALIQTDIVTLGLKHSIEYCDHPCHGRDRFE